MLSNPPFDADLLRRYDRPGPRYTSYPTAPQFSMDFDERALREAARESNGDPIPRPLSIYVHVPFCQSPCFYCGCNRIITRDRSLAEAYLARLHREIAMTRGDVRSRPRSRPAALRRRHAELPVAGATCATSSMHLRRHFHFADTSDSDLSIELDPRWLSPDDVAELADIGFNRASLGVQDFDPAVQAAVNRVQTVEETLAIIEACRRHGLRSVNVDLIYGLPKQTPRRIREDARHGDRRAPRPARRLQLRAPAGALQAATAHRRGGASRARRQARAAAARDREAARPPATSTSAWTISRCRTTTSRWRRRAGSLHRNFMGYTTHADSDLVGIGVSAISHIGASFSQNPRDLADLAGGDRRRPPAGVSRHAPHEDDQLRADLIQQLMCQGEIPVSALERRYAIDFGDYFRDALVRLQPLIDDGLVRIDDGSHPGHVARPAAIA